MSERDLDALAPECIYLQVCDEDDCDEPFDAHHEITWCKDRINDRDVSYVRADISSDAIAALRAEIERITRLDRGLQRATADLQRDNAALRASAEQDKADAERYRWLRLNAKDRNVWQPIDAPERFDAAIDRARSQGEGTTE